MLVAILVKKVRRQICVGFYCASVYRTRFIYRHNVDVGTMRYFTAAATQFSLQSTPENPACPPAMYPSQNVKHHLASHPEADVLATDVLHPEAKIRSQESTKRTEGSLVS